MNNKIALIIGVGGQDGTLLWEYLKSKDYKIIGIARQENNYHLLDDIENVTDILNKNQVNNLVKKYLFDEVYYLAAYHHSSQDPIPDDEGLLKKSTDIHINGYFNILHAISKYSLKTKICYASSCLIYGGSETLQQNEVTLPAPNSIYAFTKLEAMHLGNYYAKKYNLKIVNTILYNHESELRSSKFLSMKIIQGAINISKGLQNNIKLGDLSTKIDQGFAGDYIKAMYLLLQNNCRGDYIISSGKLHTIQQLVEIVFNYLKLDWKKYIILDKNIIKRNTGTLFGNNTKILNDIGWKPKILFKEMIINIIRKKI